MSQFDTFTFNHQQSPILPLSRLFYRNFGFHFSLRFIFVTLNLHFGSFLIQHFLCFTLELVKITISQNLSSCFSFFPYTIPEREKKSCNKVVQMNEFLSVNVGATAYKLLVLLLFDKHIKIDIIVDINERRVSHTARLHALLHETYHVIIN